MSPSCTKMPDDRKLYRVLTPVCLLTIVFEIYILLLGAFRWQKIKSHKGNLPVKLCLSTIRLPNMGRGLIVI